MVLHQHCDLVCLHYVVCSRKRLQCELLTVGMRGNLVQQGVFIWMCSLGFLEGLEQVGGIQLAFIVGEVEALVDYFLGDVEPNFQTSV